MKAKIGFIGAGRMAESIMRGLIANGTYDRKDIISCAPSESTRARIENALGVRMYKTAGEVAGLTDVLILAIKPKGIPSLFKEERLDLEPRHLLISIAAGTKIDALHSLSPKCRIVRVMPNHCCEVYECASGYARGINSTDEDVRLVEAIFTSFGVALEVQEKDMDAVTGVCGSSPAYMYMFIRAIARKGVEHGLSEETSLRLAAQAAIGAGKMALCSDKSLEQLIDGVCSPGGTTIEGVRSLEGDGFEDIVSDAIEAVIQRSMAMGK